MLGGVSARQLEPLRLPVIARVLCENRDMGNSIQKIIPFLWFDDQAEEAVKFYTSVFKNSRIEAVTRYGEAGPGPKGSVMTVAFELGGQKFTALKGGPVFKFTEAVSFVVTCDTRQEVDEMWEKLSAGRREVKCGWLKDKYGLEAAYHQR